MTHQVTAGSEGPEQAGVATGAQRVLFLCTHNSSRSQMAEGFLQARGGGRYTAFSAGTHPRGVHPLAIRAMTELGIDISEAAGQHAKSMDEFRGQPFDLVITVCDDAAEECPFYPGARRQEHWSFPDPSAASGTEEERLDAFRRVRDAIGERIACRLDFVRSRCVPACVPGCVHCVSRFGARPGTLALWNSSDSDAQFAARRWVGGTGRTGSFTSNGGTHMRGARPRRRTVNVSLALLARLVVFGAVPATIMTARAVHVSGREVP